LITLNTVKERLISHKPRQLEDVGDGEAAVAAILADSGSGEPDILLIKRAQRDDDPWSGQMAFPGGRRESWDRDLTETAGRETLEETGITLHDSDVLGQLDDIRPLGPGLPRLVVRPFVFLVSRKPEVLLNDEVDLHLWVRFSDLPGLASSSRVTVAGTKIDVPAFLIGPHVVWGLTERILKSFIELCR
jgi:8-oxo-dGTP pyrophosphatase MutT (NUDIX family)